MRKQAIVIDLEARRAKQEIDEQFSKVRKLSYPGFLIRRPTAQQAGR